MPHFEIEFWYNDHEGTRVLHPLSIERQARQREELEAQRVERLRQEEEERIVRDQQRRGLRSLYRARFEEERRRYLQPRSRARRSVGIVREERVQEELEDEEDEYQEQLEYDEKMPRGQRYEAVSITYISTDLEHTYLGKHRHSSSQKHIGPSTSSITHNPLSNSTLRFTNLQLQLGCADITLLHRRPIYSLDPKLTSTIIPHALIPRHASSLASTTARRPRRTAFSQRRVMGSSR